MKINYNTRKYKLFSDIESDSKLLSGLKIISHRIPDRKVAP
jgi:hypothetical protein